MESTRPQSSGYRVPFFAASSWGLWATLRYTQEETLGTPYALGSIPQSFLQLLREHIHFLFVSCHHSCCPPRTRKILIRLFIPLAQIYIDSFELGRDPAGTGAIALELVQRCNAALETFTGPLVAKLPNNTPNSPKTRKNW